MNTLIALPGADTPITMSSREIADLLEARHDSVKRTIDRLVEKGVIAQPPMEDVQETATTPTGGRRKYTTSIYHIEKRDSFVVVAQLSPEFTARLVDRWQELEAGLAARPAIIDVRDPSQLAQIANQLIEVTRDQARQIEAMREDVEKLDRIAEADGSFCITNAAKLLQMRPKDLFEWLQGNGWIYRRPGSTGYLGYQSKTATSLLEHKVTTVLRADGSEKVTEQVRVTAKGLTKLAALIKPRMN